MRKRDQSVPSSDHGAKGVEGDGTEEGLSPTPANWWSGKLSQLGLVWSPSWPCYGTFLAGKCPY